MVAITLTLCLFSYAVGVTSYALIAAFILRPREPAPRRATK